MSTQLLEKTELLDFQAMFQNDHPVELEIGTGRGKFLVARAQADKNTNFIGIDRVGKWMKRAQKNREKQVLENLFFFKAKARDFLFKVPAQSVHAFHLYFLDPWPKSRHRRRRLITFDFLAVLAYRLQKGGAIEVATDDSIYFEEIQVAAEKTSFFWSDIKVQVDKRIVYPELKTSYELKWQKEGRTLFYMELRKGS